MPLIGGGGAGNVAGGNPVGTGTALNYIGDHAFAYSGVISVTNSTISLLDTTIGATYIVAKVQPSVNVDTSDNMFFKILINGEEIYATLIGSTTSNSPYEEVEMIIPSYAHFQVTCENDSSSTGRECAVVVTGRAYHA